jgi:hypothetical protein
MVAVAAKYSDVLNDGDALLRFVSVRARGDLFACEEQGRTDLLLYSTW